MVITLRSFLTLGVQDAVKEKEKQQCFAGLLPLLYKSQASSASLNSWLVTVIHPSNGRFRRAVSLDDRALLAELSQRFGPSIADSNVSGHGIDCHDCHAMRTLSFPRPTIKDFRHVL